MKTTFKLEIFDHYECISSLAGLAKGEVLEHLYFLLDDLCCENILIQLEEDVKDEV